MKTIKYVLLTVIGTALSFTLLHKPKEKGMGTRERELILNDLSKLDK